MSEHIAHDTDWDLRPFTEGLAPGQMSPWATEHKDTVRDQRNCNHAHVQSGQF